jgi:hypothetical protein
MAATMAGQTPGQSNMPQGAGAPQYGPGNRSPGWFANRQPGALIDQRMALNAQGQPNFGNSANVGPSGEVFNAPPPTVSPGSRGNEGGGWGPESPEMIEAQRRMDEQAAQQAQNQHNYQQTQVIPGVSTAVNPSGLAATNPLATQMNAAFRGSGQAVPGVAQAKPNPLVYNGPPIPNAAIPNPNQLAPRPTTAPAGGNEIRRTQAKKIF